MRNIELLDKRNNNHGFVKDDHLIIYNGDSVRCYDLEDDDMYVSGIIIQEDGTQDILFKFKEFNDD